MCEHSHIGKKNVLCKPNVPEIKDLWML